MDRKKNQQMFLFCFLWGNYSQTKNTFFEASLKHCVAGKTKRKTSMDEFEVELIVSNSP